MASATLSQFAGSLPCFKSLGRKRMKLITDVYPEFYNIPKNELFSKIVSIKTFSDKTAQQVINGQDKFMEYLAIYNMKYQFKSGTDVQELLSNKLQQKVYCFSGIRNKKVETYILENGGQVVSGIRSNVTDIIVKDVNSSSKKIEKAKAKGVNIVGFENFVQLNAISV